MRSQLLVAIALAGCVSTPRDPDYATGATTVDVQIEITDNFAAMEEVPVAGGELRLVAARPLVRDDGPQLQAIGFPLKHTDVRTRISGMSAIYTVTQTFENPYDEPLDAVYVFPLGDDAAVTDYAIVIGERTIAGEIKRKQEAQQIYAEAKAKGHTTALLEQEKRNIFKQRIANIAPREQIQVRMQYIELLDYRDGQYEIAFPLTIGPRYLPAHALGKSPVGAHRVGGNGRSGVTSIPYADENVAGSTVSFRADVDAGVPVLGVASPSHQLRVEDTSSTRRTITLAAPDEMPNRDLVVRYKTASETTMVGLLAHRTAKTGYFTLVVQPKAHYKTGDIANREVMIVIDTSGSMQGQPMDQAQRLAVALIASLRPTDTFNVLAFSGSTNAMAPAAIPGNPGNKEHGKAFVLALESGGGTEMGTAMAAALQRDPGADRIRMVYFLTDGFVGNDDVILKAARGNLGSNRIFSIGIGSAPNRSLLNQIAAVGRGYASYLNLTENPQDLGEDLVARSAFPYLTNIEIEWNGLAVGAVTPAAIPDVYAGMPLVVSGVYTQPGRGKVVVHASTAGRRIQIPIEVTLPDRFDAEPVAALYGRKQIDELYAVAGEDGLDREAVSQVTELGLAFHMVTEYTSFVAVDRSRVVNPDGTSRIVEQPALIPAGVNAETAIGAAEPPPARAPTYSSSRRSYGGGGGGGWGGGGGGGDVDWVTLLLGLALVPLAWTLRRIRS